MYTCEYNCADRSVITVNFVCVSWSVAIITRKCPNLRRNFRLRSRVAEVQRDFVNVTLTYARLWECNRKSSPFTEYHNGARTSRGSSCATFGYVFVLRNGPAKKQFPTQMPLLTDVCRERVQIYAFIPSTSYYRRRPVRRWSARIANKTASAPGFQISFYLEPVYRVLREFVNVLSLLTTRTGEDLHHPTCPLGRFSRYYGILKITAEHSKHRATSHGIFRHRLS